MTNSPQSQCVCARLSLTLPDEVAAFSLTQQLVGCFSGYHPVVPAHRMWFMSLAGGELEQESEKTS